MEEADIWLMSSKPPNLEAKSYHVVQNLKREKLKTENDCFR